jgi:hypothetical protein
MILAKSEPESPHAKNRLGKLSEASSFTTFSTYWRRKMTLRDIVSSGLLQSIGIVGLLLANKAAQAESAPVRDREADPQERLRDRHGVKLIAREEEGGGINAIPAGTYGWTYAPATEAPLFASRGYQSFEMHKASDGSVYVIGYIAKSDAGAREVKLYPEPYEADTELVALRLDRIYFSKRQPAGERGNWLPLSLTE